MDKNYYEILEVDKHASREVIEKAYKTLAKKYHPDLQDDIHKKQAEETFKIINEAYETLSNPEQRALYDQKLASTTVSQDKYNEMYKQNEFLKNKLNDLQKNMHNQNNYSQNSNISHSPYSNTYQNSTNSGQTQNSSEYSKNGEAEYYRKQLEYEQQINQARQKAYHDAYIQDMKNRGYRIRYKRTFKEFCKNLLSLFIAITFLLIILRLPFVQNFFHEISKNNPLLRLLLDIF